MKALMLLALDGNSAAYRTLLEELSRLLKAYFVRRLFGGRVSEAEDLVQETLLAIHTRRMTYDREMTFLPWVNAIARHKLVDHLRRQGRHDTDVLDEDIAIPGEAANVEARMDVDRMLGGVSERTAGLIRKVKIEGQSIDEAARAGDMSQSAVKVAIHRGLATLAQRFGGKKDNR
ncbi:sigma-70 family RNA polymerase sigma factor [Brucella melitensis]|uniref:RNA polymerase sigma factor, sigma-70 family protein n=4 Tax=Brucella/Ochrobactrum group TaxID=2826938 RepID=C0RJX4_BRUMB|nr:RNA polymerase sigma factor, sigma-70 family protein [Brucella melitensis ATCC 23457]ADZ67271.1 RNA polymerase sigma factor, sigma-70 family protein [Brucella melitensis M28]ADZ88139.1 RNA polymerase sigma factor, sigma-70 family protein [Brucella melitensis M5-90]AEQ09731.1 RNA polymerase sigma factor, sigma-70 family protein [Brucella melitensis NI]AQQ57686.1 RNA polymerase subunit sigma-24 [Brucella melitensis]EEW86919.1 sigma-70 region 2 protein [Brucella melitensis bv. 1 str. 16M]EEZ1